MLGRVRSFDRKCMIPGFADRGLMCNGEAFRVKMHDSRSCLSGGDVLGRGEAFRPKFMIPGFA